MKEYIIIFHNDQPIYEIEPKIEHPDCNRKFKKLKKIIGQVCADGESVEYGVYGIVGRTFIHQFKLGNRDLNMTFSYKGKIYSIQQFSLAWYLTNMVCVPIAVVLMYTIITNLILIF